MDRPNVPSLMKISFPGRTWATLLKLGAGSVAGAALIKYGSITFPEITKPNLLEAMFLISTPVVIAVLLLIKLSKRE